MPQVTFPQSVVTGIGAGPDEAVLKQSKNQIVKVFKGETTYNKELTTDFVYVNDITAQPYQPRAEKWSSTKQKVAQWAHASHLGAEKCLVKYTVDFLHGFCEMETFGRRDKYAVVKSLRISNVTVAEISSMNLEVYSVVKDMRDSGTVQEIEAEVVVLFDGLKTMETYTKVNRFLIKGDGGFFDVNTAQ